MAIPKVIHYCWFGPNPFPSQVKRCITSWEEYLPEYEIRRWDESNAPLDVPFVQKAYEKGFWAFVADYVRFWVLFEEGGIYLDTDMLLIRKLDPFLSSNCFFGCETDRIVSCGIVGAIPSHPVIGRIKGRYEDLDFNENMLITVPQLVTAVLIESGFRDAEITTQVEDVDIYSPKYFYPLPFEKADQSYQNYLSQESVTVHLWQESWHSEWQLLKKRRLTKAMRRILLELGENPVKPIRYFLKLAYYLFRLNDVKVSLQKALWEMAGRFFSYRPFKRLAIDSGRIPYKGRKHIADKLIPKFDGNSRIEENIEGVFYGLHLAEHNSQRIFFNLFDEGTEELFKLVKEDHIVFDVGANIGYYTLNFARRTNKEVISVFAFEPYPDNFLLLQDNIGRNEFCNVEVFHLGLGDEEGAVNWEVFGEENNGMVRVEIEDTTDSPQSRIITLDSFVAQNQIDKIDIIKVDIEGFELRFLMGAKQVLAQFRPLLFIELCDVNLKHFGDTPRDLIHFLESLNYEVFHAKDGYLITSRNYLGDCFFDVICQPI